MRNVVNLTTIRKEQQVENKKDDAQDFISYFYDWCREQGIDVTTTKFKFDAAVILTTIQSLLHEKD